MNQIKILFSIFLILQSISLIGQEKVYELQSVKKHSDINYKLFELFNDLEIYKDDKLKLAFEPIKGDYKVYLFIAEFMGDSFDGTRKTFHDYLILKTAMKSKQIIDGYQYTMEWAEPPAISDLYRITNRTIEISNNLNISELKMMLVGSDFMIDWKENLNEQALIKLK